MPVSSPTHCIAKRQPQQQQQQQPSQQISHTDFTSTIISFLRFLLFRHDTLRAPTDESTCRKDGSVVCQNPRYPQYIDLMV